MKLIEHVVNGVTSPMRIDRYLRIINTSWTQGVIEGFLRKGVVKVNNIGKVTSSFRVNAGDVLLLDSYIMNVPSNAAFDVSLNIFSPPTIALAKRLRNELLIFDHPLFFAINKPNNVACQGGSKISLSIDDALRYLGKDASHFDHPRLVHRLDKETSGILLIAKNYEGARILTGAFNVNQSEFLIKKEYVAILTGNVEKKNGVIDIPISKNQNGPYLCQNSDAKEMLNALKAVTEYRVIDYVGKNTVVLFRPLTGRIHQIRLHAKAIGHPIVGDTRYNIYSTESPMMLHAYKVTIPYEIFERDNRSLDLHREPIVISCNVPKYFGIIVEHMFHCHSLEHNRIPY